MKDFVLYFLFILLVSLIDFIYMKFVLNFDVDELTICMIAAVFEQIVLAVFMYIVYNS